MSATEVLKSGAVGGVFGAGAPILGEAISESKAGKTFAKMFASEGEVSLPKNLKSHGTAEGNGGAELESTALHVPEQRSVPGANSSVPHGFANVHEFAQFGNDMRAGLDRAGYENAEPLLQGKREFDHTYCG